MDLKTFAQKFQSYSGLVLVFFVAVHLAGVIFAGIDPGAFEVYASKLHSNIFLPYFEKVLASTFIIHIFLTIKKIFPTPSLEPKDAKDPLEV